MEFYKYIVLFVLPFYLLGNTKVNSEAIKTCSLPTSLSQYERKMQEEAMKQDTLIKWSETKKLRWDYFKGKPDTITFQGAAAASNIWIPFENFKVYDDSVVMDLPCYFVTTQSWKMVTTPILLNHEQGHFDIAEIIARKMRRDISNYISTDDDASNKFFQSVSDKYYFKENSALNEAYDKETDFSKNIEEQKRWNAKIAKMLKELEAYSSPHVVVKRIK